MALLVCHMCPRVRHFLSITPNVSMPTVVLLLELARARLISHFVCPKKLSNAQCLAQYQLAAEVTTTVGSVYPCFVFLFREDLNSRLIMI